jgi:hypothetical protein
MTYEHPNDHDNLTGDNRPSTRRPAVALTPILGAAALMLAACSNHYDTLSPSQRAQTEAPLIGYSKCMHSHGVGDFPDPSISSAGGIGYSNAETQPINRNSPTYQAARTACQRQPGASTVQRLLK